ncbi:ankyrin repeat, SAM and basic leucine zipper domain-containing protein 1 [Eurosta solidaginis]|uniref:ankyrin repeat, SAM and basic leucine zipper domain-containing protein 1 n=1 Tax=Eurosta solidaginis TaxID=178769 RepID=UPI0035313EED
MAGPKINYGPPMSDSDDSDGYEGYYFGDMPSKKSSKTTSIWQEQQNKQAEMLMSIRNGDVESLRQQVRELSTSIDEPINSGFTLLMTACREGQLSIVKYLIEELKADVNKQVDSFTPLMLACESTAKEPHVIDQIVQVLLKHGAVINASDKYGTTPFMHACKNGYTSVVRRMLQDVSFDAVDNQGCTPIFHAIENNRLDIVKLLVEAGVNATIANRKGYTPVQVAQFHGFYDMLELLPREKDTYVVPPQYLGYNTLRDYIPRIFLKSDCPEYFQEINAILLSLNMGKFLEYFAKEKISLLQFLAMNDEKMVDIGIKYPIFRMKMMKGLLDFHLHHWSKKSIARVSRSSKENFYEILMVTANHLQHLVIITATLRFVKEKIKCDELGVVSQDQLGTLQNQLNAYRTTIKELNKTTKYLASFSPAKNPLYIDYDEHLAERKRLKLKTYFKYTTIVIGISVFIGLKVRKFLFTS